MERFVTSRAMRRPEEEEEELHRQVAGGGITGCQALCFLILAAHRSMQVGSSDPAIIQFIPVKPKSDFISGNIIVVVLSEHRPLICCT
jgi:hypothetical protein